MGYQSKALDILYQLIPIIVISEKKKFSSYFPTIFFMCPYNTFARVPKNAKIEPPPTKMV